MTPFPSKPPGRSPASVPTTESAHVVWLRVAFSGRHTDAAEHIDERLRARLHRSGLGCCITGTRLTLMGQLRVVTPTDWTDVIGWLLCPPEVVFVAREYPITRRSYGQPK